MVRELLDLLLIVQVALEVTVESFLLEHRLLIEQPLGEGVVLSLDALRLTLAHAHVQTCRPVDRLPHRRAALLLGRWRYRGPLARADLDELVEQYLVVLVDRYVFLVLQEILRLLPFFSFSSKHLSDLASSVCL